MWLLLVSQRSWADAPLHGEWVSVSCVHGRVETIGDKLQLAQQIDSRALYGADEPPWPLRDTPRRPCSALVCSASTAANVRVQNRDACRVRVAIACGPSSTRVCPVCPHIGKLDPVRVPVPVPVRDPVCVSASTKTWTDGPGVICSVRNGTGSVVE